MNKKRFFARRRPRVTDFAVTIRPPRNRTEFLPANLPLQHLDDRRIDREHRPPPPPPPLPLRAFRHLGHARGARVEGVRDLLQLQLARRGEPNDLRLASFGHQDLAAARYDLLGRRAVAGLPLGLDQEIGDSVSVTEDEVENVEDGEHEEAQDFVNGSPRQCEKCSGFGHDYSHFGEEKGEQRGWGGGVGEIQENGFEAPIVGVVDGCV